MSQNEAVDAEHPAGTGDTGHREDAEAPGAPGTGRPDPGSGIPEHVRSLDPRSLRGLAHPLRIRLLGALREYGPATASQLGARLGESSGATSYHLRQLAEHGFVVDVPELGTARERWWRAGQRGIQSRTKDFAGHPDPAVRGAFALLLHEVATIHAQELSTWLGTLHEWSDEWRDAGEVSDYSVRLTPELAKEMNQELQEVIQGYRERAVEAGVEGSAPVRVHVHAFPRAEEKPDGPGGRPGSGEGAPGPEPGGPKNP
ncbi:winged helix-turn-helix domain-containing protein [Streptomyces xinghaiensis]|uniref:winged helix-turn-helix domain-containing protein n=1 Tax=Streptomyces xinghaiensis TaxID=1038928 RepID=UPI000BB0AFDF|nr:helix-turn-helix domain-containing protein [Streptomyces xinghaiensis]MZE76179.1 helix-turn-helix domain-containing protein [Streptomyces sp. SID5475]